MIPDRVNRLNSLIQTELSRIMERYQESWSSFASGFLLTITRVEVERSLEHANVYYSWTAPGAPRVSEEPDEETTAARKEVQRVLDAAAYDLAHELAERVRLRKFPKLIFIFDPNIEAGDRVYEILKNLDKEKEK